MRVRVPDVLSISRIIISPTLILLEPVSVAFLAIYSLCCLTDVLDGAIARRNKDPSVTGAVLDSLGDIVLVASLLISIVPIIGWRVWMIVWISVIVTMRIMAATTGLMRFGRLCFIHTYLNKASGFALFILPFLIRAVGSEISVTIACVVATAASAEYLLMCITMNEYDPDRVSIVC